MAIRKTDKTRWMINLFRAAERLGVEDIEDREYPKINRLYSAGRPASHAALIMWGDPSAKASDNEPRML